MFSLAADRSPRLRGHVAAAAPRAWACSLPVHEGGSLRARQVLQAAEDGRNAGVFGVLPTPVSCQPLTEEDVVGLFEEVAADLSVPLVIYDIPGTTHFPFTDVLYTRPAWLPQVASIKIAALPADSLRPPAPRSSSPSWSSSARPCRSRSGPPPRSGRPGATSAGCCPTASSSAPSSSSASSTPPCSPPSAAPPTSRRASTGSLRRATRTPSASTPSAS